MCKETYPSWLEANSTEITEKICLDSRLYGASGCSIEN